MSLLETFPSIFFRVVFVNTRSSWNLYFILLILFLFHRNSGRYVYMLYMYFTRIWNILVVSCCEECATHCPDGWVYFRNSCYFFAIDSELDWTESAVSLSGQELLYSNVLWDKRVIKTNSSLFFQLSWTDRRVKFIVLRFVSLGRKHAYLI